jgi:Transposase
MSLDEAHRRGRERATVVSGLDRRCAVEVLDGRSPRRVGRYLRSLPEQQRRAIEVVSIDPYDAYRQPIRAQRPGARIVADHFHLYAAPTPRSTPPSASTNASTGGASRSAPDAADRAPAGAKSLPLPPPPAQGQGGLSEGERSRLCVLFEREPLIAEAWALKEAFRSIYRAPHQREAERRLDHLLSAVERAGLPAFSAFADGVRLRRWGGSRTSTSRPPTATPKGSSTRSK